MKILQEVEGYISLLESRSEWLMRRIVKYGKDHNYLQNIQPLHNFLQGNLQVLINYFKKELTDQNFWSSEVTFDNNASNIPVLNVQYITDDSDTEIVLDYSLFLKYTRQAFIDLANECSFTANVKELLRECINANFENMELALTTNKLKSLNTQVKNIDQAKAVGSYEYLFHPVLLFNNMGGMMYCNTAADRMFTDLDQHSDQSGKNLLLHVIGTRLPGLLNSDDDYTIFEAKVEHTKQDRLFKIYLRKVSDDTHNVLAFIQDLTTYVKTINDLKESRRRAEESDHLKTAFIANMSHEIRTPMNAIIGFTDLIINKNLSVNNATEYLKLIRKSSSDLLNLIEDIIDIAKLESKQLKVKYRACKPYILFNDLVAVFNETLRRYGTYERVTLHIDVEQRYKDFEIYTDGERLKQVLTNLLGNAVKFTEEGTITLSYKVIKNTSIVFSVCDTGVGIPKTVKDKVFNRFFQVENHLPLNMGGAGLGLAICKSILQLLGGTISVESEQGKGTCFSFQLPIHTVPESKKIGKAKLVTRHEVRYPNFKGKTILVAEDERTNYLLLKELFEKTQAKLLWAKNGVEAIEMVESNNTIDMVLMDIKMPELDGFQATKYITSICPGLPVVAQTAYSMDGDDEKCYKAGCVDYINKPINKEKLFEITSRCMHKNAVEYDQVLST